jgi:hypothetical protein
MNPCLAADRLYKDSWIKHPDFYNYESQSAARQAIRGFLLLCCPLFHFIPHIIG